MKKYIKLLPFLVGILSITTLVPFAYANITIDGKAFSKQTSVAGKTFYYKFTNISEPQTDGAYDLGIAADLFEQGISSGSGDIYDDITATFSGSSTGGLGIETATDFGIYKSGTDYVNKIELEKREGSQDTSQLQSKFFGTYYYSSLFSKRDSEKPHSVNPGNYSVAFKYQNTLIDTISICLPTFLSDTKNSIGNVSCSNTTTNTQNTNQTSSGNNTSQNSQTASVNILTCNLFKGSATGYREPTPDSGEDTASRIQGIKDIPVGSNDQTRLFTYGLEDIPRHITGNARENSFDTHLALVRNEKTAKSDRKQIPYSFEIGFSTVNNTANFKWFPIGQGTMETKDSDSLISYSIRVTGLKPGTKYWYTIRDTQYGTMLSTVYTTTTGTYVAPVNIQQSDCYVGTNTLQNNNSNNTSSNNNNIQSSQNTNQTSSGNNTSQNSQTASNGTTIVDPDINQTPNSTLTPCTDAKSADCYQLLEPLPQKQEDGTYKYINNFNIGTEGKDDKGIAGFINFMFEIGIGIAGVLGVVMLTIYGFQYASNDKNINTFAELKSKITNVIFGILLLLGIFIILRTINPDLLIVEPDIAKQLLQLEETAIKDSYGNPVLTGGGEEYDPTGKNDVQRINKNISEYDSIFKKYASEYSVSCNLLKATMYRESGGNPNLTSSRGAQGLMQFMPGTAAEYGFSSADMFIPEKAIHAGAKFYKNLFSNGCNLQKSNSVCTTSNIKYVVAAYNAGPGSNRPSSRCDNQTAWECVLAPDFKETRKYVPIVLNNALELKSRGWGCE